MTGDREKWRSSLREALAHVQAALEKVEDGSLEDIDGDLGGAQDCLRAVSEAVAKIEQEGDPEWLDGYSREWFREADVMRAILDALPTDPILVEGTYRWSIREVVRPPLRMPPEYEKFRDGPTGIIEVACNTQFVTLAVAVAHSGVKT